MKLGAFKHTSLEKKRYTISYADWLAVAETVASVTYAISPITVPALTITGSAINVGSTSITFFVSGGLTERTYLIQVLMQTSATQFKEDTITVNVEDNFA